MLTFRTRLTSDSNLTHIRTLQAAIQYSKLTLKDTCTHKGISNDNKKKILLKIPSNKNNNKNARRVKEYCALERLTH